MTMRWMLLVSCVVLGSLGCGDDDGGGGGGPRDGEIQFGSCPSFAGCGNEVEGTWRYDGACFDDPVAFQTSECPTLSVVNTVGEVSGTLTFSGGTLTQTTTASLTTTIGIPSSCTMGLPCSTIEDALAGSDGIDSASCTDSSSGGCTCTVGVLNTSMGTDTYTIEGNIATTGGGTRYEYCVVGGTLRYRDLDETDMPAVFTLVR